MAIPVWPTLLPQRVTIMGYSERLADGRLKSQTDTGPGKVRRRYSSAARQVNAQIVLYQDQKSRFDRFWNEDTKGGALPFIMPDQTGDGWALLDDLGTPILDNLLNPLLVTSLWLARFDEAPTISLIGGVFHIAFTLSVLP